MNAHQLLVPTAKEYRLGLAEIFEISVQRISMNSYDRMKVNKKGEANTGKQFLF